MLFRKKRKETIIHTIQDEGFSIDICAREPEIGELSCTWFPGKEKQMGPGKKLGIFVYDEDCASRSDQFDFRVIIINKQK